MIWRNSTVGDFCPFTYGKAIKKDEKLEEGIPVFGSNGIYTYKENALAGPYVVIIGRKGTVGKVHISETPCWVSDTAFYISYDSLDEAYFTYFLLSTLSLENMNTDAAVPGLNRENAHRLEIEIPEDSSSRKQLAKPLIDLSKKIRNNQQINQTLEQMAQTIFKSWFVDFEPVKAKVAALEAGRTKEDALIAAMQAISGKDKAQLAHFKAEQPEQYNELRTTAELFPSAMQDSELGEIPEGWESSNFGAVSKCFDRYRVPLSKRQREQRRGSIPYYGATSVMDYVDEPIFDGVYLLLGEDGSVLKDDGSPFTQYIWGKAWVNNHAHVLQGANGVSTEQLYLFIGMQNITAYVTGAVQLKLNQKNMNSIPFIKAPKELNTRFSEHIAPKFSLRRKLIEETRSLTKLRDALLPRLLSGELSVEEAIVSTTEKVEAAEVSHRLKL